ALQNEVAQTNQINNLSNVTLSSPTIVSPSVAGLSTSQVSEGSNLYFTNARAQAAIGYGTTTANAWSALQIFNGGLALTGGATFDNATSTNLVATNATTTNFAVLGTGYFAGNIGIGTTTPPVPLTIDSTSANGSILRISN